jgi:glycosyltransferase involved in cell wall biosynthesis
MTGAAVAINASVVGRNPTGLGLYAINLVQRLDRMRQDFELFTSSPGAFAPIRAPVRRLWPLVRPEHGLGGHAARLAWTQVALRVRARGARVLLNTVPEGPIGGAPDQVTVVHDLLPLFFPEEYPRQQHYFRHLVPRVLRRSRVVVADSESTRQEVLRRYALPAAQVRVVYPGFDPERFHHGDERPRPASEIPYLLYVGNLLPHKNLLRLVEAFAEVRRRCPCRLVIRGAGRPAHTRALEARIEALGVSDAVDVVEYAGIDALRDLYARAACLVYPSLAEGFGLPILEAMASGTPVVTSNISSLPEVAGGAALTVDPYDAGALAEAIGLVLTRPALQVELRARGLERVRQFSWEQTAAEISRLIDGALAGGEGARA